MKRDWTDVRLQGACEKCGTTVGLQRAHIVPRRDDERTPPAGRLRRLSEQAGLSRAQAELHWYETFDRYVNPLNILTLCGPCHGLFDTHQLDDVLGLINHASRWWLVDYHGLGRALRVTDSPISMSRDAFFAHPLSGVNNRKWWS